MLIWYFALSAKRRFKPQKREHQAFCGDIFEGYKRDIMEHYEILGVSENGVYPQGCFFMNEHMMTN
jgi:hypothetical protein